ncbi:hypothetical protein PROFUN_15565 [Planoprotostelium fungivorum]|uniref:BTB domain-containing protein n=1 Tax=Planoprotostelium fungivorum TaxID=1890364 RepID=A0A2P6MZ21_9EUKA|nr:hypothetical protein PROFUN_15565 [Planoprotostelium fungivorum]
MSSRRRVTLFPNGYKRGGRVIFVPNQGPWREFLNQCSERMNIQVRRIFVAEGGEINDVDFIEPNEVLYCSEGEDFVCPSTSSNEWVTLNVGGRCFSTTKSTLTRDAGSMLAKMFSNEWASQRDYNGSYMVDRTPEYFAPVLNFLRCGSLVIDDDTNAEGVLEEAIFFNLTELIEPLQQIVDKQKRKQTSLTRKEMISILLASSVNSPLRCQGLDLAGCDLSKLDLSYINFSMTNFGGANLKYANLDNTVMKESNLEGADLQFATLKGANLCRANLENANLRSANFEDRGGQKANLEGAVLKGAHLEDCNFSGANLRAANLKGCNLENANLRRADLAAADLEGVNLRGANLTKANLIGANLVGANFDIRTTTPWG